MLRLKTLEWIAQLFIKNKKHRVLSPEEGRDFESITLGMTKGAMLLKQSLNDGVSDIIAATARRLTSAGVERIYSSGLTSYRFDPLKHEGWVYCTATAQMHGRFFSSCFIGMDPQELRALTEFLLGLKAVAKTKNSTSTKSAVASASDDDEESHGSNSSDESADDFGFEEDVGGDDFDSISDDSATHAKAAAVVEEPKLVTSETELRLLSRVTEFINQEFLRHNQAMEALEWQQMPLQPEGQLTYQLPLTLILGERQVQLHVFWPYALAHELDHLHEEDPVDTSHLTKERMSKALESIPVSLRVELCSMHVTLGDVERLRHGEILPIKLSERAPLKLGAFVHGYGQVFEQRGNLVLQLRE